MYVLPGGNRAHRTKKLVMICVLKNLPTIFYESLNFIQKLLLLVYRETFEHGMHMRSRSFSIFARVVFPFVVIFSTVTRSSLGSDVRVMNPLFSSLFAIPVMFAPGTSMIRLTLVILLCPFFEASNTRSTLY